MKILFLTPKLPHSRSGDGLRVVCRRIRGLIERGYQIGLASLFSGWDETGMNEWKPPNPDIRVFAFKEPGMGWVRRIGRIVWQPVPFPFCEYRSPAMLRGVGDMVENGRYDVVVAESCMMGQYLFHNPWLPAVRKIISCHKFIAAEDPAYHSDPVRIPRISLAYKRRIRSQDYELEMLNAADCVLVFTPEERFALLSRIPDLRIEVVPCGVDPLFFRPAEQSSRARVIVFTCNFSEPADSAAIDWFVRNVWPPLKYRYPDLVFQAIGPDYPPSSIKGMSSKLSGVEVFGGVEDIRQYLNHAMIYVCPVRESTGMRIGSLEAMAAGLPVITTTAGSKGIPAQAGRNCFLADDPAIMAGYLDLMLNDAPLRSSIAHQARDTVVEPFTWDRSLRRFEDILGIITR